ncbi:MAG TPA: nucleoside hydrolase [Terriglobales bacterium]|nr:nucleoside hydrolase [Terriglobales bacterium]
MPWKSCLLLSTILALTALPPLCAQERRKVIIDQDCRGPATTDLQAVLVFIQSPHVETLGVTVVSGDQWRDEEVAHTLRMLELIGRTDIPVVPGAVFPLVNNEAEMIRWEKLYGTVAYKGAWNKKKRPNFTGVWNQNYHEPFVVPPLPEGNPTTRAADEDAAHFLIRIVHKYPHEITIYAGGPLTNLALAMAIDPQFPELTRELVVMGGSLNPDPHDPEFAASPRREFNFWWDPEAAHIVLRGRWPKITVTTVDISIKTRLKQDMIRRIAQAHSPVADYLGKWADEEYMWDELAAAAWLDPTLITREQVLYLDIDISHGAGYGNTLSWVEGDQPGLGERPAHVQVDLNLEKFYAMFVDLMTRPTPNARSLPH